MKPPLTSVYIRYPDDMRLVRSMLPQFGCGASALYIGPAFGEDFFSWLTIGFGTGVNIFWEFIEIDKEAYKKVFKEVSTFIPSVNCIHGNFTKKETIEGEYGIIIANHVWKNDVDENKNSKDNINGLRNIIAAKPKILIVRDLQFKKQPFKACLQDYTMIKPFIFRRK